MFLLSKYDQALECYDEYLSQHKSVDAMNNRARALQQLGRVDEALG